MTSGAHVKMAAPMGVLLEFGGGAELLFQGIKKHHVTLPGRPDPWDIRQLLVWIKENLLKERPELFIQGDTVKLRYGELFDENIIPDHSVHVTDVYRRPGILVLINDADWELMGELDYKIQDRDNIVFISTLHGG